MYENLKEQLTGCFYTIFTPFLENEEIDYTSLEKYISLLYKQGARKFYTMAYNSRYSQLNDQEIMELNAFCIKIVKKLNKNNIIIVGDPIHGSTKNTIEFTKHAKDLGADIISLIVREKYFSDDQILEHYSRVGIESSMPILVHEMPFLSGYNGKQMHWPKSLISSLPKIPQIVALKEDAHDFELTTTALELEPKIRIIIAGIKKSFIQYRTHGARAYLNGISIIDAKIGKLFWKAYENNDEKTIKYILDELEAPFFEKCATKYGWHRSNKALLQAAGYMHRRDRMPLQHLSDSDYVTVLSTYDEILRSWEKNYGEN
ncbi:MAG: dihydrodipicolinate synthase family protein [gamma proteobacterium symbiont of Lucinoma myriamae]|nr:dihydrodipicolinate synthase family protein [gamma proteobacterium symbiont of Lucinoma myriamae]MCU7819647.1 dihydrodipicolinate synthase family protein [gamma proteobacterium symbiont of Lucinoma myriamae]